jgi:hypothetical protein
MPNRIDQNMAKAALQMYERDHGIHFGPYVVGFIEDKSLRSTAFAADAQPSLVTTPSSGIPSFLTTHISPKHVKILTAKNAAAKILGEERVGSFIDTNWIFPVAEHDGQVSAYGDHSNSGNAGANMNFPQRQNFIFQTIGRWGQVELERAALAKIGWAEDVRGAAISVLQKFLNQMQFYGIAGLQNYGILNSPGLFPAIAPAPKAYNNGTSGPWMTGTAITATSLEMYRDVLALVTQVITQSNGNIDVDSPMKLVLSPARLAAMQNANDFNVNVKLLITTNFKNMVIESAVQYGAASAQNTQGSAVGEIMQVICTEVEGQQTATSTYSEKLRSGPVVLGLSDFAQKMSSGSFGTVVYQCFGVSTMLGI